MAVAHRKKYSDSLLCPLVMALFLPALAVHGQGLTSADILKLPECSLAKTNNSCKFVIDRENPLTPPAVQMYSNQTLTVIVKNPKPFERYFLDYQTGQATLSPDLASSIVQGLLPALGKLGEFKGRETIKALEAAGKTKDQCTESVITTTPKAGQVDGVVPAFRSCLAQLATKAIGIYQNLEPFVAPDSLTPNETAKGGNSADFNNVKDDIKKDISLLLESEFALSSRITAINTDLKNSVPDGPAILELTDLQKIADAFANDLLGYSLRITDLDSYNGGFPECKDIIKVTKDEGNHQITCVSITSKRDDDRVYHNMVTRAITYSLNTLNLVSNSQEAAPDPSKKKLLASIPINFADTPTKPSNVIPRSPLRWEASAGAFFSTLPIRSISASPVFTNIVITDNTIVQNSLHPTVVPFAAANYRLSDDLAWTRWKSAIYWTGAVGVNPNTVSADLATGLSISWRALMLSGLCHFGHDVRLTQGFQVGESLGADFKGSLPTQTYWTESFALGVSIRIPSLTGR